MKKIFTLLTLLLCAVTSSWADDVATFNFGGASDAVAGDLTAWNTSLSVGSTAKVLLGSATESGKTIKKGSSNYSGAIFELKNAESGGTSTLTTKSSYNSITKITFNITGSDAGKSYLTVQISPDEDFSVPANIVTLINNKNLKDDLSVSSNGTFSSQTCNLAAKTGYIRFTFTNNSGSANKYYMLDDVEITYTADTRDPLSLSFTPDNQTIEAGSKLSTAFSILTDISSESAKYSSVTYSSNDEAIATVNSSGVVTGVAAGTTTIKATVTADADATYRTTTVSITVNVIPTYAWSSSYGVPTGTLDLSDATTAATVLNGTTWHADYGRPIFDNDDDNNYFTCSVVTLYSATASWVKAAKGGSAKEGWSITDVFKGPSAYNMPSDNQRAATVSTGDNKYYAFRVKGVSKVKAYAKSNANSQKVYLAAFELTGGTPAASTLLFSTCGNSASVIEVSLDNSKEYVITLTNDGISNSRLYEMALFYDKSVKFEKVPVGATGYSTYSTDKNLDFTGLEIEAYQVTGANGAGTAVVKEKITGTVAANTGLLVKGSASTSYYVPVVASGTDYSATNKMKPNVTASTITAGTGGDVNYVLMNNGGTAEFQWIGSIDANLGANKAYLTLADGPKPGSSARGLSIDDEVTAIKNIKVGTEDNIYYDLNGRRVLYPTKGLYIVNGKKAIIK